MLTSLAQQVSEVAGHVAGLGGGFAGPVGGAEPFIALDERPPVGDRALEESGV